MENSKEYILGVSREELERLEFQHGVWKKYTDEFLEKTGVGIGWKCMDVGSGPGFVSADIRELIGAEGDLTALEPSDYYLNHFKAYCENQNWTNIKFINSNFEDAHLESEYFDLIFLRWVIDFVREPENYLIKLLENLKKGGVIALQDYAYENIVVFPKGGPLDNLAESIKAYWKAGGGDPYFTLKIPAIFKRNNIELTEFTPVIRAGGPESQVYQWADRFMRIHIKSMHDKNVISKKQYDEYTEDWKNHINNPDSVFLSPVIMNVIGRKL